jgi:AcrR family transcriptional regulator
MWHYMPRGRRCHIARREGRTVITGLRERKRAASRAATVDAAYALFAERGFDHTTVADICEAADIAPRTFFRYFAGKEDVVAEPVRKLSDQIIEVVIGAPPERSDAAALRDALRTVGASVVAQRERLTTFRAVISSSDHPGISRALSRWDREREIAVRLAARRGEEQPDWRLRVLVATAMAGFRIWFEEMLTIRVSDPDGHLDEILTAAGLTPEQD